MSPFFYGSGRGSELIRIFFLCCRGFFRSLRNWVYVVQFHRNGATRRTSLRFHNLKGKLTNATAMAADGFGRRFRAPNNPVLGAIFLRKRLICLNGLPLQTELHCFFRLI